MKPAETLDVRKPGVSSHSRPDSRGRSILTRGWVLWLIDVCCIAAALYAGYWLRVGSGLFGGKASVGLSRFVALIAISLGWTAIFAVEGLYRRVRVLAGLDQVLSIGKSVSLGFLLLLGLSFVWKKHYFVETRLIVAFGWAFSIILISLVRVGLIRAFLRGRIRHPGVVRRAVVVGAIPFARRFIGDKMLANNGHRVVGFVETRDGEIAADLGPEYVLGRIHALDDIVNKHEIEEIFLPIGLLETRGCFGIVSRCSRTGLPVKLVSDIFEILMPDEPKERVDGLPKIGFGEPALKGAGVVVKRLLDLVISSVVVFVFSPLLLLIASLVKALSPGPVFFRQIRAGHNGSPFTFYKFRTMSHDTDDTLHREYATNFIGGKELRLRDEQNDSEVYKMPDDPRVTSIGKILRRTSLDELPQLFNVLKGDMSLVGRPQAAHSI